MPGKSRGTPTARWSAGDLSAQTEQGYLNIAAALSSLVGSMADLTRMTVYVVELNLEKGSLVMAGKAEAAAKLGVTFRQPGMFVGVTAFFSPDFLVEIEATAVME